jgi:DNA-binding transcriptional LysR family regulator
MDTAWLEVFREVARKGSLTAAAGALGYTQSAVSRQIAALERELGVRLFERDRRTVALTPAGEQLAQDARLLLRTAHETMRRVQRADRGSRRLVVGFRSGIVPTQAIRAFNKRWPDVIVDARTLEWDDQERLITSGAVDVGFVRGPVIPDGLWLTPLFTEPRLVALPSDHALAAHDELTESDLAGERYLHFLDPVAAPGVAGRTRLRSFEEKLEHVAAGNGIILLPESATQHFRRPDVVYRQVPDAEPAEVLLAVDASRRSQLVRSFETLAVEQMSRLAPVAH